MTKKEKEEKKKLENKRTEAEKNLEEATKSGESIGIENAEKELEEINKLEEEFNSKIEETKKIDKKIKSIIVINGCGSNLHYKNSGVVLMYKEEKNKMGHIIPAKAEINTEDIDKWVKDHKEMMNNESYKKRVTDGIIKVNIEY